MKIECSSCHSKYAVPDDKVAGRKVRIRCRKCQAAIIVDGTTLVAGAQPQHSDPYQAPETSHSIPTHSMPADEVQVPARRAQKTLLGLNNPDEMASSPSNDNWGSRGSDRARVQVKPVPIQQTLQQAPAEQSGEEAWLVAIEDQQVPMTTQQVYEAYQSGAIDNETYIWREGMTSWSVPAQIPELSAMLAGAHVSESPQPGFGNPAPAASAPGFAPGPDIGSDEDGEDEPTRVADLGSLLADAASSQSAQFAMAAQAGSEEMLQQEAEERQAAEAARAAERAKRAQKAQQAKSAQKSRPRPPTPKKPGSQPQAKQAPSEQHLPIEDGPSENSMMFSLDALVGPGGAGNDESAGPLSKDEEALLLGLPEPANDPPLPFDMTAPQFNQMPAQRPAQVAALSPAAAVPTGVSVAEPFPKKSSKFPLVAAVLFIAMGAAGFWFYRQGSFGQTTTSAALNPDESERTPRSGEAATEPPTGAPAVREGSADDSAAEQEQAAEASAGGGSAAGTAPDQAATAQGNSATQAAAGTGVAGKAVSKSSGSTTSQAVTSSKATAAASKKKEEDDKKKAEAEEKKKAEAASNANGFNTGAAKSALTSASARAAAACKKPGGPSGKGRVQVTFVPSGRATRAVVGGDFAGTTVGGCIAKVFRGASVPAFDGAPVTVAKTVTIK